MCACAGAPCHSCWRCRRNCQRCKCACCSCCCVVRIVWAPPESGGGARDGRKVSLLPRTSPLPPIFTPWKILPGDPLLSRCWAVWRRRPRACVSPSLLSLPHEHARTPAASLQHATHALAASLPCMTAGSSILVPLLREVRPPSGGWLCWTSWRGEVRSSPSGAFGLGARGSGPSGALRHSLSSAETLAGSPGRALPWRSLAPAASVRQGGRGRRGSHACC